MSVVPTVACAAPVRRHSVTLRPPPTILLSLTNLKADPADFSYVTLCSQPLPNGHVCYLIRSGHPSFPRRLYIGFTANLARRLRQHNSGRGCKQTAGKQPWQLMLTIHGFSSGLDAKQVFQTVSATHATAGAVTAMSRSCRSLPD